MRGEDVYRSERIREKREEEEDGERRGGVKFRQRCWHEGGGPRLEASLQASSLIHTSAPLVSSLVSGTESWRSLSSHDFEKFGEEMELLNETWKLFSLPLPPLFVIRWIKVQRSSEDWDKKFSPVKVQRNIYFNICCIFSLFFLFFKSSRKNVEIFLRKIIGRNIPIDIIYEAKG